MPVEPLQLALKGMLQLLRRTGDSIDHGPGLASHRGGLLPFDAGFHHAPLVVVPTLVAVLVAEMNFHARDVSADVAKESLQN